MGKGEGEKGKGKRQKAKGTKRRKIDHVPLRLDVEFSDFSDFPGFPWKWKSKVLEMDGSDKSDEKDKKEWTILWYHQRFSGIIAVEFKWDSSFMWDSCGIQSRLCRLAPRMLLSRMSTEAASLLVIHLWQSPSLDSLEPLSLALRVSGFRILHPPSHPSYILNP